MVVVGVASFFGCMAAAAYCSVETGSDIGVTCVEMHAAPVYAGKGVMVVQREPWAQVGRHGLDEALHVSECGRWLAYVHTVDHA